MGRPFITEKEDCVDTVRSSEGGKPLRFPQLELVTCPTALEKSPTIEKPYLFVF